MSSHPSRPSLREALRDLRALSFVPVGICQFLAGASAAFGSETSRSELTNPSSRSLS